jgi:hypothetical protein
VTTPSIGQWIWGEALNPCQVVGIGTKRSTGQTVLKVLCPQGSRVVPLESVRGVAQHKPDLVVMPRPIGVGDRVLLKNTALEYVVVNIYEVRCDRNSEDRPFYEKWARLTTLDGKPATWKLNQLEAAQ